MYIISEYKNEDAPYLKAIYKPFVTQTAITFEYTLPNDEEWKKRLGQIAHKYPFLVLRNPELRPIGYAYASEHRKREAYQWAVETSIYIESEARGQGLGKRLYQLLIEKLVERQFRIAYGVITLPNVQSVKLHESCGYQKFAVFEKAGFKNGIWHDVVWMRRELNPFITHLLPPFYGQITAKEQIDE